MAAMPAVKYEPEYEPDHDDLVETLPLVRDRAGDHNVSPLLLPHDREWTVDDLDHLPDDGLQYELFDGVLVVSPSPKKPHQRAVLRMAQLLDDGCPAHLEVFIAPLDFQPDEKNSYQPDVLVVDGDDPDGDKQTTPPLLAVEVLSPSTAMKDRRLKLPAYADTGIASFWLFDTKTTELAAYELRDSEYAEVARGSGDDEVTLERPFPVTVRPGSLIEAGR